VIPAKGGSKSRRVIGGFFDFFSIFHQNACGFWKKFVFLQRQNPPRFPKTSEPGRVFYL